VSEVREDLEKLKRETGIVSDGTHAFAPWIGVDLDGTLAHYERWVGIHHIGEPIEPMLLRVKRWVAEGALVKIFTARMCHPGAEIPIQDWLERHGLPRLECTNVKDYGMLTLWDDRAIQVQHNVGEPVA
jgi:hypothetical protein